MSITESRFYMWRAVFAFVHADHKVTEEEREFAQKYLQSVDFSKAQKEQLLQDLEDPQSPADMYSKITQAEDRGEFFQFARMLCWCDGDYAVQEEMIFEKLKDTQLSTLDRDNLRQEIEETRYHEYLKELTEDQEFQDMAEQKLGFLSFLKGMARV